MSESSAEIRKRLSHPVIDIDGHMAEYFPALAPYLVAEGLSLDHPSLMRLLPPYSGSERRGTNRHRSNERPHAPLGALGGALRPSRRSTWPPRSSPASSTSGSTSSGSTSAWCIRASGSSSCTWPTRPTGAAPAGRSTVAMPRPSRPIPIASLPSPPSRCTPPRRRSPSSSTPSTSSASKPSSAPAMSSVLSRPWPTPTPRSPSTPSGSTSSASTACMTTTRCGRRPRSSACQSPSTPASSG